MDVSVMFCALYIYSCFNKILDTFLHLIFLPLINPKTSYMASMLHHITLNINTINLC